LVKFVDIAISSVCAELKAGRQTDDVAAHCQNIIIITTQLESSNGSILRDVMAQFEFEEIEREKQTCKLIKLTASSPR
jgi:hypothetical protein